MNNYIIYSHACRKFRWGLVLGLVTLSLLNYASAEQMLSDKVNEGRKALNDQDFERARNIFSECLERAQESEDREWEVKSSFYLALTLQQQGKAATDDTERTTLFSEAESYYQACLSLRPEWGPALNNLAELYADLDRDDEAARLFRKAVSPDDLRQPLYILNYSKFLSHRGKWKDAAKHLKLVIEKQPWNDQAYEGLLDLYLQNDRSELLRYLWDLVDQGQVTRAQEGALKTLQVEPWSEDEKRELLTIAVVCLSEQQYDPKSFLETDTAQTLGKLAMRDATLRQGIEQILLLHRGQELSHNGYGWWAAWIYSYRDAPRGVWPLEGFRQLIRSLGSWFRESKSLDLAESYYLLAARLSPDDPDPEAYALLADLYTDSDNLDALKDLIEQEEGRLFGGKAEAYRNSQKKRIYQFHRTLGIIYSYLGRWESDWAPASAIFQLEHALEAANLYNRSVESEDRLTVEPRLISLLATAYHETNRREEALERYREAREISIRIEDRLGEAEALSGIGKIYQSESEYAKALEYYAMSSEVEKEIGNREGELANHKMSLEIHRGLGDKEQEAKTLGKMGVAYESMGEYDQALEAYETSITGFIESEPGLLPSFLPESVRELLTVGMATPTNSVNLALAELQDESMRSEIRSTYLEEKPVPLSPILTAVRSTQPTLQWRAVSGMHEYEVIVAASDDTVIWEGTAGIQTEIELPADRLRRGMTYFWQVEALLESQSRLSPIVGFWVLNMKALHEVETVERYYLNSALVLASVYEAHGLYEDALVQIERLMEEVPNTPVAKKILNNLRRRLGRD